MGRPADFTSETATIICDALTDGRSLRSICLDGGMPDQRTVYRWLRDDRYAEFRQQYAHAREQQADTLVDEIVDIADDGSNDYMGDDDKYNGDAVQRSKLRIDARKWMAGKLKPKVYGDKQTVDMNVGVTDEVAEWLGLKS